MKKIGIYSLTFVVIDLATLGGCAVNKNTSNNAPINEETFTITWKNWDGTILEVDENVSYGTMASYDSDDPTKPDNDEYAYIWEGEWSSPVGYVYSDCVYVAIFAEKEKIYLTPKNRTNFFDLEFNIQLDESSITYDYGYKGYSRFTLYINTINVNNSFQYFDVKDNLELDIKYTYPDFDTGTTTISMGFEIELDETGCCSFAKLVENNDVIPFPPIGQISSVSLSKSPYGVEILSGYAIEK